MPQMMLPGRCLDLDELDPEVWAEEASSTFKGSTKAAPAEKVDNVREQGSIKNF